MSEGGGLQHATRAELLAAAGRELPQFVSAAALFQLAVADQLGLGANDLHCLNLVGSGIATTPTQLAARLGMTTGAVTKLLDRLERERLVRREPDPTDRRRLVVRLREDRLDELDALYLPLSRHLADQMDRLTDDQLRLLASFASGGREVALREATQLRRAGKRHAVRQRRAPIAP
jgi:DNA-binding MarR family transcriptional regulator